MRGALQSMSVGGSRRAAIVVPALICAALALSLGCSHQVTPEESLNEREYARYRTAGSATIEGQVTMTLSNGTTLEGSACEVRLTPITTSSTEYIQKVVVPGGTKQWEEDADSIWWLAQADAAGRFRFEQVPPGSYYLTCLAAWREPGSDSVKQRILWTETTVGTGQTVTVNVSR